MDKITIYSPMNLSESPVNQLRERLIRFFISLSYQHKLSEQPVFYLTQSNTDFVCLALSDLYLKLY